MKKILTSLFSFIVVTLPLASFAADTFYNFNPYKSNVVNLTQFIKVITDNIVIPIGGVIVVIMIIWAGFLFVTAQGNENKVSDAKRAFTYAVIGAVILLGAWVIASVIGQTVCSLYDPANRPAALKCN